MTSDLRRSTASSVLHSVEGSSQEDLLTSAPDSDSLSAVIKRASQSITPPASPWKPAVLQPPAWRINKAAAAPSYLACSARPQSALRLMLRLGTHVDRSPAPPIVSHRTSANHRADWRTPTNQRRSWLKPISYWLDMKFRSSSGGERHHSEWNHQLLCYQWREINWINPVSF